MRKITALAFLSAILLTACSAPPEHNANTGDDPAPKQSALTESPKINLPSDPKSFAGWQLEQTNRVAGDQTVYMCPAACKVENHQMDVNYTLTSADWNVYVYSDSRKLIYHGLFKDMIQARKEQQESAEKTSNTEDTQSAYQAGDTDTISGLKATCYTAKTKNPENPGQDTITEMWFTNDIDLPIQYSQLQIQPGTGLPDHGVLLRMAVTEEGEKNTIFDTVSAKQLQIAPDIFKLPAGYGSAADEAAVTLGDEEGSALQDMYHGLQQQSNKDQTDDSK